MGVVRFARGGIYYNNGAHIVDLRVISCYLGSYIKTSTGYLNPPHSLYRRSPVFAYLDYEGSKSLTTLKQKLLNVAWPLSLVCVQQEDENSEELGESVCTNDLLVSAIDHKPGCFLLRGMLVPTGDDVYILKTVSWAVLEKEQEEEEIEKAEQKAAEEAQWAMNYPEEQPMKLPPEEYDGIDEDPQKANWQVWHLYGTGKQRHFLVPYLKASDDVTVFVNNVNITTIDNHAYALLTGMIYFSTAPISGASIRLQRPQTIASAPLISETSLQKISEQIKKKAQKYGMPLPEPPKQPEKKHIQLFVKRQVSFEDE